MTAQCIAATPRQQQISLAQANAREWRSASILGRVGNRKNWNWAVKGEQRGFSVYVYYSDLHLRGYSESSENIPYPREARYRLNVYPKPGQVPVSEKATVS